MDKKGKKSSLEIGPLAYMYRNAFCKGKIKPEFEYINEYIKEMSLDMRTASQFGEKLFCVKELRNETAHGGMALDINRARKAQDVSYIHFPKQDQACQISIADQCHALIVELLEWFSK